MKILLLEDNYLQGEWLYDNLHREFGRAPLWIETEREFRDRINEIVSAKPDVAVIDEMLRWENPEDHSNPPGDREKAGLRCSEMLETNCEGHTIPVIIYTVLPESRVSHDDWSPIKVFLSKGADLDPLFREIRRLADRG